jgi:hypothetical protein
MLGLIGVLGALMAGVVGDALMSLVGKDDDETAPEDDAETPPHETDLLDDSDVVETETPDPVFPEGDTDPAEDVPLPQEPPSGATISGADADEFIMGTADADWIDGAGGADTLDGGAGSDTLHGGAGDDALTGAGDDAADHLYGGEGDDRLQVGAGDTARGDAGDDAFTLSDYGPDDPPSVIADYTPGEDRIVLMYDPDLHPEPMVQTESIEGTEDVSVLLDGIQIAIVQGGAGLAWDDIELLAA